MPQPVVFMARVLLTVFVLTIAITALVGEGSLYKLLHDVASAVWPVNGNRSARL